MREVRLVREREIHRERQKWRHHCRAKIGDEFTRSLAKFRTWLWVYTFPCQKFALFVSPFTLPISPFLYCGAEIRVAMSSHFPLPKNFALFVPTLSSGGNVLPIEKLNQINTKNYWNRKTDCAWGCARGINTTRENLQITKHKSGRRSADFLWWCLSPERNLTHNLFSISNSFWY